MRVSSTKVLTVDILVKFRYNYFNYILNIPIHFDCGLFSAFSNPDRNCFSTECHKCPKFLYLKSEMITWWWFRRH